MLSEISQSEKDKWSHLYEECNEQNKVMNKIETEAWIHETDWQLSGVMAGREEWMKESEGISQRTYTHNS